MKKNIAIIAGGYSSELVVSMKSAETIYNNLPSEKYNRFKIIITQDKWYATINDIKVTVDKNDFSILIDDEKITFDCAYITIHGTPGEDGKLQGYFDMLNIPYSTASQSTSSLTFNKWMCNQVLANNGVKCSKSIILRSKDHTYTEEFILTEVGLPCFVKPNDGGSSFGISKVTKANKLSEAIENAFSQGKEVLIEAFMAGSEVTCGAYKHNGKVFALPITEIVSQNDFFDFDAKYNGLSDEITPARISDELTKEVQELTTYIYQLLDLSGIIRVDYILKNNTPHVIEVNATPGMSQQSIIPQQIAYQENLELGQLLDWMIEEGIKKKQ
jgi:D-alanine-D-alanine ligase